MPVKNNKFVNVKKILLFRLCCLGDVAMLTPVINNLHKNFTAAEIKIASSKWIENLLPFLPYISDALYFDAPFEKNFILKLFRTLKFILLLRKEKFDMVFLAHRHNFYGLLLKLSGIRYRLGFSETKYLTHTGDYNHNVHFVNRHLEILTKNGLDAFDSNLILKINRGEEEILTEYGLNGSNFIIGIFPFGGSNPGTQMDIKRWEYSKYIELINKLAEVNRTITLIVFEGYLESEKINEEFKKQNIRKLKISNYLTSVCDIFVSGDTGPLYIAEALGVSTLSIFGPSDAEKIAPKSNRNGILNRVIWKKPYCSPCYTTYTALERNNPKYWKDNNFICNTGTHECITSITVDYVKNVLCEMIEELTALKRK